MYKVRARAVSAADIELYQDDGGDTVLAIHVVDRQETIRVRLTVYEAQNLAGWIIRNAGKADGSHPG